MVFYRFDTLPVQSGRDAGIHWTKTSELSVLKWKDVDFENQTISITKTFSYGDSKAGNDIKLAPPKTPESERVIDIDEFVIVQLKRHQS